ncbi:endonuclease domain-containing protein [Microterricola viridarii]|uniref:Very-short-patch-repair endonuclease n=1 Tax=Microterricola viridarii TaxID=412690 RepID=A0A1H1VNU1_9MICO|nr:DUF559 domain-containing protein [Microterricola viridarii]SDS85709.1 Very-short-patch-repair endonuclease [Microterricola viridarii]
MSLARWLTEHDGIAHSQQALRAGFTRYAIRAAVDTEVIGRVRRDWIALPDAPAELRAAAELGGRVACLSAAKRLGLWHLADGQQHFSASHGSGHTAVGPGQRVHWSIGPVAVTHHALVEPVENALVHIADCQPFVNALAVWDSALNTKLVTPHHLARLPLRTRAARAVREAMSSLSDSGIETIPVARLAALGITVKQQVVLAGHRVDGLIGQRLVLQIDGYTHHSSAAQRGADIAHDRALTLLGYTVLRVDYRQVLFDWPRVEADILRALAQRLHEAR